jgi:hypothetical protein
MRCVARIYLSSTYSDLIEQREAIYHVLRQLGHDVIAMEDYVASDQRPIDRCLEDVARSDIYLGVIAWRYGYVPSGMTNSITELEFRHAQTRAIPTLIFILDENAPWPPSKMDRPPTQIERFRQELRTSLLITLFQNTADLSAKVSVAVVRQLQPRPDTRSLTSQNTPPAEARIEVRLSIDFLPVDARSPMLLGFAVDVSGSMQVSFSASGQSRLQGVLAAIRELSRTAEGESDPAKERLLQAIKAFAYGFGFTNHAADFGALAGLAGQWLGVDVPKTPSRIYKGSVRDLLSMSGLGSKAILLAELGRRWSEFEERLWEQRFDLFGDTPMRQALQSVHERYRQEVANYKGTPRSVLIVISDGDSTDGTPVDECEAMMAEGVIVIGGYLKSSDVTEPKTLYARPLSSWPNGAKTLFECCSKIGEDGAVLGVFSSKGWKAAAGDRLFVQLNQSEMLSDFLSSIVEAHAHISHH